MKLKKGKEQAKEEEEGEESLIQLNDTLCFD